MHRLSCGSIPVEAVNEMFRSRHQTSQGAANLRGADKNGKERRSPPLHMRKCMTFFQAWVARASHKLLYRNVLCLSLNNMFINAIRAILYLPIYLGYSYLMSYLANHAAEEVRSLSLNFLIYKI
jgi:hypothetical protein